MFFGYRLDKYMDFIVINIFGMRSEIFFLSDNLG